MKKIILLTIYALCLNSITMAQESIRVKGKIDKVTVFVNDAKIEKSASFPLKQGNNEIILESNSIYLFPNTIGFNVEGDFMIVDNSAYTQKIKAVDINKLRLNDKERKKLEILKDSLEKLDFKLTQMNNFMSVLKSEKNALQNMKVISASQQVDSVAKMKEGLAFYRTKIMEVNSEIQTNEIQLTKLQKQISVLKEEISIINQEDINKIINDNEFCIKLNIYSNKNIPNANLQYYYNVGRVGWQPIYNIQVKNNNEPISIDLKAELTQLTGEDWSNVKLIFSNEASSYGAYLGELTPYYIEKPKPLMYKSSPMARTAMKEEKNDIIETLDEVVFYEAGGLYRSNQTMLGKTYELGLNNTVLCDASKKQFTLETKKINSIFKYYSIPKISKAVFLTSLIPSWQEMELMSAEAKIYLGNNLVNTIFLDANNTSDTLNISIGQDKRVAIDRKVTKSTPSKAGIISNSEETTITITLSIKNNNPNNISLVLEDQIPISQRSDVKVSFENKTKATFDEKTGSLIWDLDMVSGESKTIEFSYSVKYPKGERLILN